MFVNPSIISDAQLPRSVTWNPVCDSLLVNVNYGDNASAAAREECLIDLWELIHMDRLELDWDEIWSNCENDPSGDTMQNIMIRSK